jgi:hypothetical protein
MPLTSAAPALAVTVVGRWWWRWWAPAINSNREVQPHLPLCHCTRCLTHQFLVSCMESTMRPTAYPGSFDAQCCSVVLVCWINGAYSVSSLRHCRMQYVCSPAHAYIPVHTAHASHLGCARACCHSGWEMVVEMVGTCNQQQQGSTATFVSQRLHRSL